MSKERGAVMENKATQTVDRHNPGRMRDFWKRVTDLGLGGGIVAIVLGAIFSSGFVVGAGLVGLGAAVVGKIGQGLTRR